MNEEKKICLPKGFLSENGYPTFNAVVSYFVYLNNLPRGWKEIDIHEPSVQKVRDYWGWKHNTGFGTMFKWGISLGCSKSRTSDERYQAMSIAYQLAKGMIGEGVVYTDIKIEQEDYFKVAA